MAKISLWSTFKNRPDTDYASPPLDPANMGTNHLQTAEMSEAAEYRTASTCPFET